MTTVKRNLESGAVALIKKSAQITFNINFCFYQIANQKGFCCFLLLFLLFVVVVVVCCCLLLFVVVVCCLCL